MTRREAIEILKQYSLYSPTSQIEEALDMAIEALSADAEPKRVLQGYCKGANTIKTIRHEELTQIANTRKAVESADAVHGEWEFVDNEIFAGEYFCSVCGKRAEVDLYGEWILSNFCPSCGARMYKGGDSE